MLAIVVSLLIGQVGGASPPLEKIPTPTEIVWTPIEAVTAAAADLATIPADDQPHQWYLWVRTPKDETLDAMAYALNTAVSASGLALRAKTVAEGRLLRLDLREWLPDDDRTDSDEIGKPRRRFEQIVAGYVDPYFYVSAGSLQDTGAVITSVNPVKLLNLVTGAVPAKWPPEVIRELPGGRIEIRTEPYTYKGDRYTAATCTRANYDRAVKEKEGNGGRNGGTDAAGTDSPRFSPVIIAEAADAATTLQTLTGRLVPIVEAERWLVQSLSTIDGGIYYKLRGFDDVLTGKRLNREQWLELWGANLDPERQTELVGQWRSGVTFQPRRAVFGVGNNIRQSTSYPLVVLTEDIAEGTFDPAKHPIYSLGDSFRHDAVEAIASQSNGFHAYALFDGAGVLVDEAPPEIAADRTALSGSTRLQPAISCIRCHEPYDGWHPMPNHVQTLLGDRVKQWRLKPLAEIGEKGDQFAQLVRIAEKYSGDLAKPLQLARDSHHAAIYDVTGGRSGKATGESVKRIYNAYALEPITPAKACLELGVRCDEDVAKDVFLSLLPPQDVDALGMALEDPAIQTIRLYGASPRFVVDRLTWEANYSANLARARRDGKLPEAAK